MRRFLKLLLPKRITNYVKPHNNIRVVIKTRIYKDEKKMYIKII